MRRDPLPWLLLLLLTLLAGVAYLTAHPEHPLLDRLAGMSLIGPAAARFRELYRPPAAHPPGQPAGAGEAAVEYEVIVVEPPTPPPSGPVASPRLGSVWLGAGAALRRTPEEDGAVVEIVATLRKLTLVERRGGWRRVSRVELAGGLTEGWVRAGAWLCGGGRGEPAGRADPGDPGARVGPPAQPALSRPGSAGVAR